MSFNKKFFTTGGIVAASPSAAPITGTDHFSPVTYEGSGSTKSISSLDFPPDFVWFKRRTGSPQANNLFDSVRGQGKILYSNLSDAEGTTTNHLTSFDTNGFTVQSAQSINGIGQDYIAWCWKGGGPDVLNENGSIDSQVSANTAAGFSIGTYSGNSTAGATIGHGLTAAPELLIVKNTNTVGGSSKTWTVYAEPLGNTDYLYLATTNARDTYLYFWNNTSPINDVFSVGSDTNVNATGGNYVFYAFHSVAGYQKVGSYNGASGRATISGLGFKPRFVMIKNITTTGTNWQLFDNQRNTITDKLNNYLRANTSDSESGASTFALFVGNTQTSPVTDYNDGFQVAAVNNKQINLSGNTFIYLAIA
tara:strand:- start:6389 stop:7480 length:1092 start_codon:yes stop_codon:yes gene_type:complete